MLRNPPHMGTRELWDLRGKCSKGCSDGNAYRWLEGSRRRSRPGFKSSTIPTPCGPGGPKLCWSRGETEVFFGPKSLSSKDRSWRVLVCWLLCWGRGAVRGKISCKQSQIPDPREWGAGGETKRPSAAAQTQKLWWWQMWWWWWWFGR